MLLCCRTSRILARFVHASSHSPMLAVVSAADVPSSITYRWGGCRSGTAIGCSLLQRARTDFSPGAWKQLFIAAASFGNCDHHNSLRSRYISLHLSAEHAHRSLRPADNCKLWTFLHTERVQTKTAPIHNRFKRSE